MKQKLTTTGQLSDLLSSWDTSFNAKYKYFYDWVAYNYDLSHLSINNQLLFRGDDDTIIRDALEDYIKSNTQYDTAYESVEDEGSDFEYEVSQVLDSIKEMLIEKNRKYGDAALNPQRIFSNADSVEQIKVRIDDKLNRMKNKQTDDTEDITRDLMGYLVLLTIAQQRLDN